jgi:hypothetical protein
MAIQFNLIPEQERALKEWQEKIKDLFGKYGLYDFTFTPNGIGESLIVKSHLTGTSIDLTDVELW